MYTFGGLLNKIYQSKANLDVDILQIKITHHLDQEIRRMLERGLHGNEDSIFDSDPCCLVLTIQ